ncbi:MAG: alpha/beta fold hydrolase [Solirubrobacteraceae bacterium]
MSTVAVDGVELFYEELGSGSTILLVHGTGGNADVWGDCAAQLAQDHRVIAYDRRGYSRSAHAPVNDLALHSRDAAALLRALDGGPATVVGWSAGGLVALGLAIGHPDLVSGLALEEPPLYVKKHPALGPMRAIGTAQVLRRLGRERQGAERFYRWAMSYRTGGTAFDRFPPPLQEALLDNAAATMAELDAGTGEHLTREQIASITCPVTCLVSDLTPEAFTKATSRIADILPEATVKEISGAGHAIHFDRPTEFIEAVREAARDER